MARPLLRRPRSWNLARVVYVQIATIPVAVAGLLLLIDASGALYWLAGAVLWAVVAGGGNAWVLIVEIVRDAHYRPLDQEEQSSPSSRDRWCAGRRRWRLARSLVSACYPTAQALWKASAWSCAKSRKLRGLVPVTCATSGETALASSRS